MFILSKICEVKEINFSIFSIISGKKVSYSLKIIYPGIFKTPTYVARIQQHILVVKLSFKSSCIS